jgi:hypothetical protein
LAMAVWAPNERWAPPYLREANPNIVRFLHNRKALFGANPAGILADPSPRASDRSMGNG